MRIIYVGKHSSGGNDDEGAIHYALEELGHEVVRVRESHTKGLPQLRGDFLLCHHWHDMETLARVSIPKVFWCFDLVDWPNGGARHSQRREWMRALTNVCDLGFLTDGDWVAQDETGKLYWLTQGADERPVSTHPVVHHEKQVDVLFVGGLGYGREDFVKDLRERYGDRFKHVLKGCHGASLADEIGRTKIVVAPDSPVTDRYWSNRVYNVLALGGLLIHPGATELEKQYGYGELLMYRGRDQMHDQIDHALSSPEFCASMQLAGYRRTMTDHTYRHRCEVLVRTVRERLGI